MQAFILLNRASPSVWNTRQKRSLLETQQNKRGRNQRTIQRSNKRNFDVIFNGKAISIKQIDKNDLTPGVGDSGDGTWVINDRVKICGTEFPVSGQIYYLGK